MKTTLILILALLSSLAFGQGDAPPFIQGQTQTAKPVATVIKVPHKQATKTTASQGLIETGNTNRLENPGFEHQVPGTGWTTASTGTAVGTYGVDTTTPFEGLKSLTLSCDGGASGGTCTISQDAVTRSEAQALSAIYLYPSIASDAIRIYAKQNGALTSFYKNTLNRRVSAWDFYDVPVAGGTTSTGIAIQITVPASTTYTVKLDNGQVGHQNLRADAIQVLKQTFSQTTPSLLTTTGTIRFPVAGAVTSGNGCFTYDETTGRWTAIKRCLFAMDVGLTISTAAANFIIEINGVERQRSNTTPNASAYRAFASIHRILEPTDYITIGAGSNTIAQSATLLNLVATSVEGSETYSSKNSDTDWASCGHTTSDFTGFGTVTNIETQCKREGSDLLMRGKFTSGIATAVEARVNLKLGGAALTSAGSSVIPSLQNAGSGGTNRSDASQANMYPTIEPSVGYITFARTQNSVAGLTKINGNDVLASGNLYSFTARIPIAGWDNSNVIVANLSGLESCTDTFECTDTYSLKVNQAGDAISDLNVPGWVTGPCTDTDAGESSCTFKTGLFTVAPNCTCSIANQTSSGDCKVSASTTAVSIYSSVATNYNVQLNCQKAGADFIGKTAKAVASDQNLRLPGIVKAAIYQAEVSSSDVVTDENADWINGSCTNASTGFATCTYNSGVFSPSVAPKCWMSWIQTSAANAPVVCAFSPAPSSTALTVVCKDGGGAVVNSPFTLFCMAPTP